MFKLDNLVMRAKRAVMMKILSVIARVMSSLWKVSENSFLLMIMTVRVFPGIRQMNCGFVIDKKCYLTILASLL